MQKGSKELGKKVRKNSSKKRSKGNNELYKNVCKKWSKELGKNVRQRSSKDLPEKVGKQVARK